MFSSNKVNELMNKNSELLTQVVALTSQLKELKQRVIDLEDAHEKSTGIKVRVDNSVTIAKFTKMEMCMLQGVLKQYMGKISNIDDSEFAMALYRKMTPIIDGMKEDVYGKA